MALAALAVGAFAAACDPPDDDAARRAGSRPSAPSTTLRRGSPVTRSPDAPSTTTTAPLRTRPLRPGEVLVVTYDGVLGWWTGSAWVGRPDIQPDTEIPVVGRELYVIVRGGSAPQPAGGPGTVPELGCSGRWPTLEVPGLADEPGVAVTGDVDVHPRTVATEPNPGVHVGEAARLLRAHGLDDPAPRIVDAVRADLDGDGSIEVVVVARTGSETFEKPEQGDASIVFVRPAAGGESTTVEVMIADDPRPGPQIRWWHRLAAVGDFNGDGALEIAVEYRYSEGGGTLLYAAAGGALTWEPLLHIGCGS